MDSGLSLEQETLASELTQGMELAKQLRVHMNSNSSVESREILMEKILTSFDKALTILSWSRAQRQPPPVVPNIVVPESSNSGEASPPNENYDMSFKDHHDQNAASKKRKSMPTWTEQVRVSSENGLEGPVEDGYSWRKYGQKDILGATYPRSYYRCTYRHMHNCWATKQVQRSEDDPRTFEIIYRGKHSCNGIETRYGAPPTQQKRASQQQNHRQNSPPASNVSLNFNTSSSNNTNGKEITPHFTFPTTSCNWMSDESQKFELSQSFMSPASDSNYLFAPPIQQSGFESFQMEHLESDFADILSATTSASNSPILDLDFSIDPVHIDPNPFDNYGFSI